MAIKHGSKWANEIQKHISTQKYDKAGKCLAQLEQHADYIDLYPELDEAFGTLKLRETFIQCFAICFSNPEIMDFYKKVSNTIATSNTMALSDYNKELLDYILNLPSHTNKFDIEHLKQTRYYNFALKHKERLNTIYGEQ